MKGKNKEAPVTNFESLNGEIIINGKHKQQQKPHIIQLQFNPEDERTLKSPEPKVMGVSSKKKQSFFSKLSICPSIQKTRLKSQTRSTQIMGPDKHHPSLS